MQPGSRPDGRRPGGASWHAQAPGAPSDRGTAGEGTVPAGDRADGEPNTGAPAGGVPSPPTRTAPRRSADRDSDSLVRFLKELPVLLLIAFVLAFLLRTFAVQVFYIPSSSMEPTLQINDRMLVEKITYRFREPRRGEVVVFEGEQRASPSPDRNAVAELVARVGQFIGIVPVNARDFVKRVIGLPGDRVRIDEDGTVFVNDVALDEPYVSNDDRRSFGEVTVPSGTLFVLGDNRPNSSDSRASLGFVSLEDVVGRAVVIIWPPSHADTLGGPDYDVPESRVGGTELPAPARDGHGEARRPAA